MASQEEKPVLKVEAPDTSKAPPNNHGGPNGPHVRRGGVNGGNRGFRGGRGSVPLNRNFNNRPEQMDGGNFPRKRPFRNQGPGQGRNMADNNGPQNRAGNLQGPPLRNPDDRFNEKLQNLGGPTYDVPVFDTSEKKFSSRGRLYVGNIPAEFSETEMNDLFKPYGETSEAFINKEKNFGFVRLDYRLNAEKAKRELDGTVRHGRTLKIRFAPNGSSIKVKNLSPFVSNELLYHGFQVFGEIERCVIVVDDRGKSTGVGLVDYVRKSSAQHAVRRCTEGCFFLTSHGPPVGVEPYEVLDDCDGCPDKSLPKKNPEFIKAREVGPRFAVPNTFEYEYGMRWKQVHNVHVQKEESLKKEFNIETDKIEAQMQYAKYEQETEMLREQLRAREMDRDRQKREWEIKERQAEEQRARNEEQLRRQQEEMQVHMEEVRRQQQESNLFAQAHNLNNILNQEEQDMNYQQNRHSPYGEMPELDEQLAMEPKAFMNSYDRRYDGRDMGPRAGGNVGRGHWGNDRNRDDFQNKRRRY